MSPAVVFDLDGTLIDSAPALDHALNAMLAALGRPPVTLAQTTSFIGNGVAKLVERGLAATGAPADPRARALFDAAYAAAPAALTTVYPGVPAALGALRTQGARLAVCTNKPQGPAEAVLAETGLAGAFDAVVGGAEGRPLKPDPAPLRLAFARLGAEGGLFVGDSETDAETAVAAGVPFGLYTRGYRKAAAEALPAAFRFEDFAALPALAAAWARA